MRIQEYLQKNTLLADGAMGTYYSSKYHEDGLVELANLSDPSAIYKIHREYLDAGARILRTNTFAANSNFLDSEELAHEVIKKASSIAKKAVADFYEESGKNEEEYPLFIAADMGPIYDMSHRDDSDVIDEYKQMVDSFLEEGIQIFWLETQTDTYFLKPLLSYIKEVAKEAFILVSFSMDKTGYTKGGLQLDRMMQAVGQMSEVDAYGLNCGMEAAHMYQVLEEATFPVDKPFIALPNAGYPYQLRGKTIYGKNEGYFIKMASSLASLGIDIVGGCCGTTPDYIAGLQDKIKDNPKQEKKVGASEPQKRGRTESDFWKKLQKGEKSFVVELDPPFDINIEKIETGAALLKEHHVDLLTLSDSPMARCRMDASLLASKIQREAGICVMPHMSCRDRNAISLRATMLADYVNDLRHFLVITGDPVAANDRNTIKQVFNYNSIKFMGLIQEMNADQFSQDLVVYGGALNYHGVGVDAIARRMKQKMEMGCSFFLTQPIYSDEDVARIAELKEKTGAKIIAGIMPLVSRKNALFIANEMPGMHVPQEILDTYKEGMTREEYEEVATEVSVSIAKKLSDIADGYYMMTPFNRVELICNIIERIRDELGMEKTVD